MGASFLVADPAADVAAAMQHVQNDRVRTVDGVDNHVLTGGMAAQAGAQVVADAA